MLGRMSVQVKVPNSNVGLSFNEKIIKRKRTAKPREFRKEPVFAVAIKKILATLAEQVCGELLFGMTYFLGGYEHRRGGTSPAIVVHRAGNEMA